jgi:hypothetical protein
MVIRTFELQRTEDALKGLRTSARIPGQLTAGTRKMGLLAIAVIGVETLLHGTCRQQQRLSAHGRFQRFQIEVLDALASEQCFDVPQDLSGEETGERSFF